MSQSTDGVNIIITGDASQAIREIQAAQQATETLQDQTVNVNVVANVDALRTLNNADSQFVNLGEELAAKFSSGFMKKAAKWSAKLNDWGDTVAKTFNAVSMTINAGVRTLSTALGMIAKKSLAVGGGFEAQMTTVKVISGATAEELEVLTQKAREMGASLPISAKDAATAMTLLAQRGTSVKDILASVSDVANLAISQGVSMGSAADLLGSTITNFGLAMEDASKVTAIFNNASNQSALNMSKLTEALKYVGPTAGSIGMELTEAISAMEALANAGLTGEMTGTGLAMVLTKLSTKARIMGVETKDMQGKLRPLADIFSELQAKGFSLAEASTAFGARGKLAALNLAKQSAALKENEEQLKQWGSTQTAVDEKAKTFTNTMAAFRSAVDEFHIEVFTQIKEQSKDAVSAVTQLVRAFAEWIGQTKIAEKALNAFLDGLGFKIPAGDDIKKLLEQIDVEAFAARVRELGVFIRDIANTIVLLVDTIKTPLLFLITHLNTFATISLWGWLLGLGAKIPLVLIQLAAGFLQLHNALKALSVLKFSNILAFLSSPLLWSTAGIAAIGTFAYMRIDEVQKANQKLHDALEEEKRYLREQTMANDSLELDIQVNVKTGFEKLPESWTKASDELRTRANKTVATLREAFKNNVTTAILEVMSKFPEMADAFNDSVGSMSNSTLSQLSKALQGNKEAFDDLPLHMQKVVEQLYYMDVRAGQATGSVGELLIAWKELLNKSANQGAGKNELSVFSQELSASISSLLESLPDNIERMQNFLGGQNLEVALNVSLAQAEKQIDEFSKTLGEKFNIPKEIVNSALYSRLQKIAGAGSQTAQSLVNGWKDSTQSLDSFLQSAQDAVKYLGASPEKFTPALNSLAKGIQKIDPLTGKVTERFKKAYDALKQWSSVTFDRLGQRINKLRQAVEGGFINRSALEKEAKNALQQIKVQVVADLEPLKDSFMSESAYYATVASEVYNKAFEMGGEVFADSMREELRGYYDKSGEAIGRAFVRQATDGLYSGVTMIVNGVDYAQKFRKSQPGLDLASYTKSLSASADPIVSSIQQAFSNLSFGNELSPHISGVTTALNNLKARLEVNSSVIGRASESMLAFVKSIGTLKSQNTSSSGFSGRDYSSEFSSVIKEIQNLSAGIRDNTNAVNDVASAVSSVENAVKSQQVSVDANSMSNAFSPLLTVAQNIASTASAIHSIEQYRSVYLNEISASIHSVNDSVKAASQNSNSSVDVEAISQALASELSSVFSNLNINRSDYQSVLSDTVKNLIALQQSIETLKNSTDSNRNALSELQSSVVNLNTSSRAGENFSGALAPLINAVQSLTVTVGNIHSINQSHSSAITGVTNAVRAVENAVKSLDAGNTFDIDIHQQGFVVQKKSDADMLARSTVSALRSGLGNGGV